MHSNVWHDKNLCGKNLCDQCLTHIIHTITQKFVTLEGIFTAYSILFVEPEFCFINDTPHVEGNSLELELQLLGCASLLCTDDREPFSEDCKSLLTVHQKSLLYSIVYIYSLHPQ